MATIPYASGTRLHVKVPATDVLFLEAGNTKSVLPLRAVKPAPAMRPWQANEYIGYATGKTTTIAGQIWQEVVIELALWRQRFFDSVRENVNGWFVLDEGKVFSEAEMNALATQPDPAKPAPTTTTTTDKTTVPTLGLTPTTTTAGSSTGGISTNNLIIGGLVVAVLLTLVYFFRPKRSRK